MDVMALLLDQVDDAHSLTDRMLGGMTPEQLHWCPPGSAHPIGATFAHMVSNEDWVIQTLLRGKPALYETDWHGRTGYSAEQPGGGAWEEWARTVRIDLPALHEYARAVYAATRDHIATIKADDLERVITFPPPGSMERPLSRVLSGILIRHHANHCGEIAAVKGLQGLRGYPF